MFISYMNKLYKNNYDNLKEGFTLIEIMIVVMIGALLMAAGWGGFRWYQSAQKSQTERKLGELDVHLETYRIKFGELPQDLRELIEGPAKPALRKKWGEPMADEDSLKDVWGREFVYEKTAKGYRLGSTGSTGETWIPSPRSTD